MKNQTAIELTPKLPPHQKGEPPKTGNYYFTFGSNHLDRKGRSLGGSYFIVEEKQDEEGFWNARMVVASLRGDKWAFQYTEDQKAESIDQWNLVEVKAAQIVLNE